MRKTTFTTDEYNELKKLISKKVLSDRNEQKKIRNRIRKIGFHFSDFSSKKGYDVSDLDELIKTGQIKVQGLKNSLKPKSEPIKPKKEVTRKATPNISDKSLTDPFEKAKFTDFYKLDKSILNQTGLYCIKLKKSSKLPDRYERILKDRNTRIIYIGKAQGQTLRDRLGQEVFHTSPGTFFRSIGAVLRFTPMPGHLKGKSNQKNYKFSKPDTEKITNWLLTNAEFSIYPIKENFTVEDILIAKYCPILNNKHNPRKLNELIQDRKKCREIAVGE